MPAQACLPATDTSSRPATATPRPLARGGMGEIYRATRRGARPRGRGQGARGALRARTRRCGERFTREALAAARLSGNPHIVTIFDVGETSGRPLIVMELLPGGSLEERLAGGAPRRRAGARLARAGGRRARRGPRGGDRPPRREAREPAARRARARQASPTSAIASAAGLDSFTQTGTILGTAGYLSPEQARGERATPASDRYALAVVAWELLAGRRPFERETPDRRGRRATRTTPVPSIHGANPACRAARRGLRARAREGPGDAVPDAPPSSSATSARAARRRAATRGSTPRRPRRRRVARRGAAGVARGVLALARSLRRGSSRRSLAARGGRRRRHDRRARSCTTVTQPRDDGAARRSRAPPATTPSRRRRRRRRRRRSSRAARS